MQRPAPARSRNARALGGPGRAARIVSVSSADARTVPAFSVVLVVRIAGSVLAAPAEGYVPAGTGAPAESSDLPLSKVRVRASRDPR
ncbi:hypothetical protein GCM10009853_016040 [Glycomyces scopariae]